MLHAVVLCVSQDKILLETVARSVATGAVLDQKQRWAAVMQVEPLRKVVAEALHQVSQPVSWPIKAALHRRASPRADERKERTPCRKKSE